MNFFEELYYYLKFTYFSPDLSAIKNFETYDIQRFLPYLVIGLCGGVFIAVCGSYYVSHYLGSVVRALYKSRAFTEKEAKSLDELCCNKLLIRRALFKESVISKYVKSTTPLESISDAKSALFYLPEDTKYIADKRFKASRLGKLLPVVAFFICFFACFALLLIIPEVLQFADNLITVTKG